MRRWAVIAGALIVWLLPTAVASAGDGTFSAFAGSPVTGLSGADNVAVGDFDNDGRQDDLAIGRTIAAPNVTIELGAGDGTFTSPGTFSAGAAAGPEWTAVADFNSDGNQDLAVANSSGQVAVLLGVGNGTFGAPSLINSPPIGANPRALAVGDFNGDLNADLVVANSNSATLTVLIGNGAGAFAAAPGSPFSVASFPNELAVGDFDEDGRDDVAVANYNSNNVMVLTSAITTGNLTLASTKTVTQNPGGLASGDFNGDGHLDLAVVGAVSNDVTILRGDGTGHLDLAPGSPYDVGGFPQSVVSGDFEGDNALDLAAGNYNDDNLTTLRGSGSGLFAPEPGSPVAVGDGPLGLALGDFNLDGVEDLAVANFNGAGSVSVLRGNGAPPNTGNLLQNGGAEGPTPQTKTPTATPPDIPGWTDTNNLTYTRYGAPPDFPRLDTAQQWNGGSSFFSGGTATTSSATQTVDVSASAASIDAGLAKANLSGYLGGWRFQNDRMKVTATFLDAGASALGAISIGPVTSGDRFYRLALLYRKTTGTVPAGTRSIQVRLDATKSAGTNNDGYADNLSLTLDAPAPPPTPEPTTTTTTTDTTPPDTSITAAPKRRITAHRASFSFTSTEPDSKFECSVDGKPFAPCTSPKTVRRLKLGKHTFDVRAIDAAGNTDPTPAHKGFKVVAPPQNHHHSHH